MARVEITDVNMDVVKEANKNILLHYDNRDLSQFWEVVHNAFSEQGYKKVSEITKRNKFIWY